MRFKASIEIDIPDAGPAFIAVVAEEAGEQLGVAAVALTARLQERLGVSVCVDRVDIENLDLAALS